MKSRVKKACTFISNFEETLIREAKEKQLDGVVCGHIHHPAHVDEEGFTYLNCGDWIEHCTAVVESETGHLSLLQATDLAPKIVQQELDEEPMPKGRSPMPFPWPLPDPAAEFMVKHEGMDMTAN